MKFYNNIADYYEYIFPDSSDRNRFVEDSLGVETSLLDIGCATGDFAINISESNLISCIIGIDLDSEMIKKASRKGCVHPKICFKTLNMLEIQSSFPENSFSAATCFGNTLAHLNGHTEVSAFLKQLFSVLQKDGIFICQILNYNYILDSKITTLPLIENEKIRFERYYDFTRSDNRLNFNTLLCIKETNIYYQNSIPLFPLTKQLLCDLLKEHGFSNISYYSSYKKHPYNAHALPLIITCQKT